MANHPTDIPGFDNLEAAADYIGNLRYDRLAEFLGALETKLMRDSDADWRRGRPLLSTRLHSARHKLGDARIEMTKAWGICKKFMGG